MLLWDRGDWVPIGDPRQGLSRGRLRSSSSWAKAPPDAWVLVRIRRESERTPGSDQASRRRGARWSAGRHRDRATREAFSRDGRSRRSERASRVWHSNRDAAMTSVRARRAAAPRRAPGRRGRSGDVASLRAPRPRRPGRGGGASAAAGPGAGARHPSVDEAPDGDGWLHEIKYDGFRILARIERGRARLSTGRTRTGPSASSRSRPRCPRLPVERALLDGELVVLASPTAPPVSRRSRRAPHRPRRQSWSASPSTCCTSTASTWRRRRSQRKRLLERPARPGRERGHAPVQRAHQGQGRHSSSKRVRAGSRDHLKRRDARRLRSRATGSRVKCTARQEFVISGFTEPSGSREGPGLAAARRRAGTGARSRASASRSAKATRLRYAGRVGTGFTRESLRELGRRLAAIEIDAPPFESHARARRPLGEADAGRGGLVHRDDARRAAASSVVRGTERGQALAPGWLLERPAAIDAVTPRQAGTVAPDRRERRARARRRSAARFRPPGSRSRAGSRRFAIPSPRRRAGSAPDRSPVREPGRKVPDRDRVGEEAPVVEPPRIRPRSGRQDQPPHQVASTRRASRSSRSRASSTRQRGDISARDRATAHAPLPERHRAVLSPKHPARASHDEAQQRGGDRAARNAEAYWVVGSARPGRVDPDGRARDPPVGRAWGSSRGSRIVS